MALSASILLFKSIVLNINLLLMDLILKCDIKTKKGDKGNYTINYKYSHCYRACKYVFDSVQQVQIYPWCGSPLCV